MTIAERTLANAIRALAMDAVEVAKSGHPGMPMGMADVATILYSDYLKFDPSAPGWADRDRLVLSAGHGSMLAYATLHLAGYARPTIDDIRGFRQLNSSCAGHPENFKLEAIDATTGPLGQGLAAAVGMAIAERHLNACFGDELVDHHSWVIAGDGCLMEGINHEAVGLAGHLGLRRLIVLWDDNQITIDGATDLSTSENVPARYRAAGWHVVSCDGHEFDDIRRAIEEARSDSRPSLVACRTVIGFGAPHKQGSSAAHGAPLGADEIAAARDRLGWSAPPFVIPDDVAKAWAAFGSRSTKTHNQWKERLLTHSRKKEFTERMSGDFVPGEAFATYRASLVAAPTTVASRKASQDALSALTQDVTALLGGSADLTGSNNTKTVHTKPLEKNDYSGRYIYYGVREFGMAAAMNGMALHGGIVPYGGTFLVFSDYCRAAIRLSALQCQRVIYVMTHDSIGLGEDGPTHQPVEHLQSLRAMPNLLVMRPADALETAECWAIALQQKDRPSLLALSRQSLPPIRRNAAGNAARNAAGNAARDAAGNAAGNAASNLSIRGAYRLARAVCARKVVLIATGSEVILALEIAAALEANGYGCDVVSMVCTALFDEQPEAYQADLLPHDALLVSIEAGSRFGWERYTGREGLRFGLDHFGASAPIGDLYEHFGLTTAAITPEIIAKLTA